MIDYDKWDEYYDGGFASDEPTDRFWEEYDSTLEYNRFEYGGQKINVTVKQIMQDMRVKAISDKFLYSDGTVVILLDYSKGIFDKWKNGAVLYCNGEKTYTREQDMTELSIVIQGIKPGMQIDDALLKNATEIYISQHIRILEDSVRLVMESKNQKTREERYDLSLQHFDALSKIQKYADKKQKKRIADAQDQFMIMNENYKHPERIRKQEKQDRKKKKRDDFWETYGTMEILDDILGDHKKS